MPGTSVIRSAIRQLGSHLGCDQGIHMQGGDYGATIVVPRFSSCDVLVMVPSAAPGPITNALATPYFPLLISDAY